jgi:hypothetical protein
MQDIEMSILNYVDEEFSRMNADLKASLNNQHESSSSPSNSLGRSIPNNDEYVDFIEGQARV